VFGANAAWALVATLAHNLLRWVAALGLDAHGLVVAKTIRRRFITLPGRLTHTARRRHLHLPSGWPWAEGFRTAWPACARSRCRPDPSSPVPADTDTTALARRSMPGQLPTAPRRSSTTPDPPQPLANPHSLRHRTHPQRQHPPSPLGRRAHQHPRTVPRWIQA
jgi:Transposase DDE domain group 1